MLLLAAYAAATWFPEPGLWLREINFLGAAIQPPQILLAALLFSAGLCASRESVRSILSAQERIVVLAAVAWLVPLAAAFLSVAILWGGLAGPASVALGVVIVAAMPVANSSIGWATSRGGNVSLSIALLIFGTALSPLLTPLAIRVGAIRLETAEHALTQTPWSQGMGLFFLIWVLIPVLLGVGLASRFSSPVARRVIPVARQLSFAILILLNYLNAAPCLPALAQEPELLLWPLLGSSSLLLLSFVGVRLVPQRNSAESVSLILAVVMRNTGAALVFAGAALPDYVLVSLTIIAYTMLQHCWVGFFLSALPTNEPRAELLEQPAGI